MRQAGISTGFFQKTRYTEGAEDGDVLRHRSYLYPHKPADSAGLGAHGSGRPFFRKTLANTTGFS